MLPIYTGDANCDGGVDLADAVSVLNYLFGQSGGAPVVPCCMANMDANNDNKVNVADAISILRFLFAGGSLIAPDGMNAQSGCLPYLTVILPCNQPCRPPCVLDGLVTCDGAPAADATVVASLVGTCGGVCGQLQERTQTDANGYYCFAGLPGGHSADVTAH